MKKHLILSVIILMMVGMTTTNVAQAIDNSTPYYETPSGKEFEYYFRDAYWQLREYKELGYQKDWCLTIVPNQDRNWGLLSSDREQAWNYILARFGNDYRWDNESILKKQFNCHVRYNFFKKVWNIEPWRTSYNFVDCNEPWITSYNFVNCN